jgi:NTP pyrophosphatase (non-canonical NTP hydrolase)
MNNNFLDYIQTLSLRDKKTLSQKALKATEEVGEIARVVLPYDGAYATNHRFSSPEDILEECVDTMLCVLSIAYHLGFTNDDIDDMALDKSKKWAKLQSNEDNAQFPLPYEIHVTVSGYPNKGTVAEFKEWCIGIGVKLITLDLQNKNGLVVLQDVMTSSKHFGDNKSAYLEAQRISTALKSLGLVVKRVKIETVPWHPAAPHQINDDMPKDCYFEAHIPVRIVNEQYQNLKNFATNHYIHISKNVFKTHEDGTSTYKLTMREHNGWAGKFQLTVNRIPLEMMKVCSVEHIGKIITEFSIYDTNVSHDSAWILGNDGTKPGPIQNT